jgi:hypothetical protein
VLGSEGVPRVKPEDVQQGEGMATVLSGSTGCLSPTWEPAGVQVDALFDYLAVRAIVTGPLFPERIEVLAMAPMGAAKLVEAAVSEAVA